MGDQYDEILDRMSESSDPAFDAVWKAMAPASARDARLLGRNARIQAQRDAATRQRARQMQSTLGGPKGPPPTRRAPGPTGPLPSPARIPLPTPPVPDEPAEAAEETTASRRRPLRSELPRRRRTSRATSSIPDAVNVASTGRELRPLEERTAGLIPRTVLTPAVTSSPPSTEPEAPARSSSMKIEGSGNISMRNGQLTVNGKEVELDEEGNYSEPGISITPSSGPKDREDKTDDAVRLFDAVQRNKREREDREAERAREDREATPSEGPIEPPTRGEGTPDSDKLQDAFEAAQKDPSKFPEYIETYGGEHAERFGAESLEELKENISSRMATEPEKETQAVEAGVAAMTGKGPNPDPAPAPPAEDSPKPKQNKIAKPASEVKEIKEEPEKPKPKSGGKRTNAQLREALKAMGLSTKGNKADLTERLNAADSEKAESKPKAAAKAEQDEKNMLENDPSYKKRFKMIQSMFQGKPEGIKFFRDNPDQLDQLTESQQKKFREVSETPASKEPNIKAAVKGKKPAKKTAAKKEEEENPTAGLPKAADKKKASKQAGAISGKAPPPRRDSKKGK